MHLHLPKTIFFFFGFMIYTFFQAPRLAFAQDDPGYLNCGATFTCGNISDIGFPFWGSSRPSYCGLPGFELNCTDQAAEITIKDLTYRILQIEEESRSLTVARTDYIGDVCPTRFINTTLDTAIFNFTSDTVYIGVYYGCPMIPPQLFHYYGLTSQFSCNINNSDSRGYYGTRDLSETAWANLTDTLTRAYGPCKNNVLVPAYQTNVRSLENNSTEGNLIATLNNGFGLTWTASNSTCEVCTASGGICGFDEITVSITCDSRSSSDNSGSGLNIRTKLLIGLTTGGVTFIIVIYCVLSSFLRNKLASVSSMINAATCPNKSNRNIESFLRNHGALSLKRYSFSDVNKMTNSFKHQLGQGGYGRVYKGTLRHDCPVAVKVLNISKGNGEEFINEVASISRTSHVNIVNLLGFCVEGRKRILIYEFIPNGSLDKFIGSKTSVDDQQLGWENLYHIALGVARGLEYLHRGCNTRIVHLDIKPHNVLLDEDFCPKISDFGLAKLVYKKESAVSLAEARGTIGYIAPELFIRHLGRVSYKSDVYSYGMMTLEMVGARNKVPEEVENSTDEYFPNWIYTQLATNDMSETFGLTTMKEAEVVRKMTVVGLWCIQTNPSERPSTSKVIEMLEGSIEVLQIPEKPSCASPPRLPLDSFTLSID